MIQIPWGFILWSSASAKIYSINIKYVLFRNLEYNLWKIIIIINVVLKFSIFRETWRNSFKMTISQWSFCCSCTVNQGYVSCLALRVFENWNQESDGRFQVPISDKLKYSHPKIQSVRLVSCSPITDFRWILVKRLKKGAMYLVNMFSAWDDFSRVCLWVVQLAPKISILDRPKKEFK